MFKSFPSGPLSAIGSAGILILSVLCAPAAQKIKVYDIPKERPPGSGHGGEASPHSAHAAGAVDPHAGIPAAMPKLKWSKLPEGWKENPAPGSMRAASFLVTDAQGSEAEMAAIPMGGMAGIESQLVNMWRNQLKLDQINDGDMSKLGEEVQVADAKARLYEMVSIEPVIGGKYKARILVAMLKKPETTWFFKFAGEEALVGGQKSAFLEFLKGVSFEAAQLPAGHPPVAGGAAAGAGAGMGQGMMGGAMQGGDTVKAGTGEHPEWQVPASWTALDHSSFLVAKFRATGDGGAQADINVSMSAGDGGGLLPNVNRWRGQLSLGPLDQDALAKISTVIDLPTGKATVVDISGAESENGGKARCIGVMVPIKGETWFYKLMGADTVVAREKEALLKFVRSVKYSHAP